MTIERIMMIIGLAIVILWMILAYLAAREGKK